MIIDKKIWREELPAFIFFSLFMVLFIWISLHRTPWRDEMITLYFLIPSELFEGIRSDLHHPVMFLFDFVIQGLVGKDETGHRITHGAFSIFGNVALYLGLRKKFSVYEALSIVMLATTWAGGIYFSTSLRSNWSLLVVPQVIFGFYPYFRSLSALKLVPLLTFFCSLHLLNLIGIPLAVVLAAFWYDNKLPSKRIIQIVSGSLFFCLVLLGIKDFIFGLPTYKPWSPGLSTQSLVNNLRQFAEPPSESQTYLMKNNQLYSSWTFQFLIFAPLALFLIASINGFKQIKDRLLRGGFPLLAGLFIYSSLIIAELFGIRLFSYRNLHFAHFLFWVSFGLIIFTFPKFRILSKAIFVVLVGSNLTFFFYLCGYPKAGPIEKELAEMAISMAQKENALIYAQNDCVLFKIYNPSTYGAFEYTCDAPERYTFQNRTYILTNFSWIVLTDWKVVNKRLLELGFKEKFHQSFGYHEFIRIYAPPGSASQTGSASP